MIYAQLRTTKKTAPKRDNCRRFFHNYLLIFLEFWQKFSTPFILTTFFFLQAANNQPVFSREPIKLPRFTNSLLGEDLHTAQSLPALEINRPIIKVGSSGADVSELQAVLKLLGYYTGLVDGMFTEKTAMAVSLFQQAAGLDADGIVGADTWNRLFPPVSLILVSEANNPVTSVSVPSSLPSSKTWPLLSRGTSGTEVERLQERLRDRGFFSGNITGNFGPKTEAAVRAAQQYYGIKSDGIVGPATWRVLMR